MPSKFVNVNKQQTDNRQDANLTNLLGCKGRRVDQFPTDLISQPALHSYVAANHQMTPASRDGKASNHDGKAGRHDIVSTKRDGKPSNHDGKAGRHKIVPAKRDGKPSNHDGKAGRHDIVPAKHDGKPSSHDGKAGRRDGYPSSLAGVPGRRARKQIRELRQAWQAPLTPAKDPEHKTFFEIKGSGNLTRTAQAITSISGIIKYIRMLRSLPP